MQGILYNCRRVVARAWPIVAIAMLLTPIFLVCGCGSGTKKINTAASNSAALARQIEVHADSLRPMVEDRPEAAKHVEGISQAARDIGVEADKIHAAIPSVKDREPWWAQMLGNATWIVLICLVLFALFYFGLAAPIRAFFVFIGSFVPAILPNRVKSNAKLDAESWETNPSPELDKTITVRRASDPMYDAAWKAMKREAAKQAKKDKP